MEEMGSSLAGVYALHPRRLREGFSSMDEKVTWLREFSGGRVSWATSNPCMINLASRELQLEAFFDWFHLI